MAPTFQQQDDSLNADIASRGINNSTAASQLDANLQGQQAATLASADAGLVSQGYGAATTGAEQNAAAQNAASQYNSGVDNSSNFYNSQLYNGIINGNVAGQNGYLSTLESQNNAFGGAGLADYLGSFGNLTAANDLGSAVPGAYSNAAGTYTGTTEDNYNTAYQGYDSMMGALGGIAGAGIGLA
jgi:hypothetical protein